MALIHFKKGLSFCILILFDIALLWTSISAVYLVRLRVDWFSEPMMQSIEFYNQLFIYYFVILGFLVNEGIYTNHFDFWEEVKRIYKVLIIGLLVVFAYLALTKQAEDFSRFVVFVVFFVLMFLFPISKRFIKYYLVKAHIWGKEFKLVGSDKDIKALDEEMRENWYLGMRSNPNATSVIISSSSFDKKELSRISEKYLLKSKEVLFVPTLKEINFADADIVEMHNLRLSLIEVKNRLKSPFTLAIKMSFDFIVALFTLPFLFVFLIFIAFIVMLDSRGGAFYRQKRLGKNLSPFYCYKFRTMFVDNDEILENYLHENPEESEHFKVYRKCINDPRVTRFGSWLRKTSLDELPQIINVVKGEMSLIGPRPYMIEERHLLGKIKNDILLVKPGITGLWQISGRSELSFKQRVELDRWYVRNWTLWLDLIIFIKTIKVVIKKHGAS